MAIGVHTATINVKQETTGPILQYGQRANINGELRVVDAGEDNTDDAPLLSTYLAAEAVAGYALTGIANGIVVTTNPSV